MQHLNKKEKEFLNSLDNTIINKKDYIEILYNYIIDNSILIDTKAFTDNGKLAIKIYRKLVNKNKLKYNKEFNIETLLNEKGIKLYNQNNYEEAIKCFKLSNTPKSYYNLAICYIEVDSYKDINKAYDLLIKASNKNISLASLKLGDLIKDNIINSNIEYYKYYFKAYNQSKNNKNNIVYPKICYKISIYYYDIDKIKSKDFIIESINYFEKIDKKDEDYNKAIKLYKELNKLNIKTHLRIPDNIKILSRNDLYEAYIKTDNGYNININYENISNLLIKLLNNKNINEIKLLLYIPDYMDNYIKTIIKEKRTQEDYYNIYEINFNNKELIDFIKEFSNLINNENLINMTFINNEYEIEKLKFNYIKVKTENNIDKILKGFGITKEDNLISGYDLITSKENNIKITSYDNISFDDIILYLESYNIQINYIGKKENKNI